MESNFKSTPPSNGQEYHWLVKPITRFLTNFAKLKIFQLISEKQAGDYLMATRIFCDHCGLKIPLAKKFYFGRCESQPQQMITASTGLLGVGSYGIAQQAYAQQNVQYGQAVNYPTAPVSSPERHFPTVIVDLCDVCVPIWYERACNLTKATKD
jgi:hypothetical protein